MVSMTAISMSVLVILHVTLLMVTTAPAIPLHGSADIDSEKDLERGSPSSSSVSSSSSRRFLHMIDSKGQRWSRDWPRGKREARRHHARRSPRMRLDLCEDAGHFEDCFLCGKMADDARIFYGCCSGEPRVTYFCKELLY